MIQRVNAYKIGPNYTEDPKRAFAFLLEKEMSKTNPKINFIDCLTIIEKKDIVKKIIKKYEEEISAQQ